MDLGLDGRVAIVTGSSRGIGRATAELLAAEGAQVAVTFRRDCRRAEAVVNRIQRNGGDAFAVPLDLAIPQSIDAAIGEVGRRWGRLDVLVNNAVEWVHASEQRHDLFEKTRRSEWQSLMRTNIEGVYGAVQAAVPLMRPNTWGRIVNVSSVAAEDGMPGYAWYAASKAALHGLTRTLAKELGPAGVLVNVVMPAGTVTSSVVEQVPFPALALQARQLPTRRLPLPEDVACAIVFLASAANTTITGEIVRVSGGRM